MALVVAIGMIVFLDLVLLIDWVIDKAIVKLFFGDDNLSFKIVVKIMIISNIAILIVGLLYVIL